MKPFFQIALLAVAMLSFISCERHSWEDEADGTKGTKRLYPQEKKSEHGKADHSGHEHDKKDESSH